MNKTFTQFVNHLDGFTQRIVDHYPYMEDFIDQEKKQMLEKFPQLGQMTSPTKQGFEMVRHVTQIYQQRKTEMLS